MNRTTVALIVALSALALPSISEAACTEWGSYTTDPNHGFSTACVCGGIEGHTEMHSAQSTGTSTSSGWAHVHDENNTSKEVQVNIVCNNRSGNTVSLLSSWATRNSGISRFCPSTHPFYWKARCKMRNK